MSRYFPHFLLLYVLFAFLDCLLQLMCVPGAGTGFRPPLQPGCLPLLNLSTLGTTLLGLAASARFLWSIPAASRNRFR